MCKGQVTQGHECVWVSTNCYEDQLIEQVRLDHTHAHMYADTHTLENHHNEACFTRLRNQHSKCMRENKTD